MHSVSSIFLEKIKQSDRVVRGKLLLGDIELTQEDIISMSIESSLGNDNIPAIGGVVASRLEVKLLKNNVPPVITTQELKPFLGLEIAPEEIEYVPMGVFRVNPQDIKKTDNTISITGYDQLYATENMPYVTDLDFPANWNQIKADLETKSFKFKNQSLPNVTIKEKPDTIRELLSDVAELMGRNVVSNRLGEIEFRGLTVTTFETDNYNSFRLLTEDTVKLTRLTVEKEGEEEEDITYGDDTGFTIKIRNNSITTQSELATVYNRIFPLEYIAYECELQGLPHLDVGDIIKLIDRHDVARYIPIVYHKITYSGGLRSEIRADAPKDVVSSTGSTGSTSITQSLRNLRVNLFEVNHLLADKASINDLEANTARIDELYATKANISDLQATNARVDTLEAGYADIAELEARVANIDTILSKEIFAELAEIGQIRAGSSIIAEGAIGDAHISDLSADKLTSGTVDTSKVSIIGPQGRMQLRGNRLQIFDDDGAGNLYERIFLGVDGDDAKLTLRGADGQTVLLTQDGLTDAGFTDGYNKVADDSLDPKKLDIQKVVRRINEGTETIEASKILLDNKTLDVQFSTIESTVSDHSTAISNQSSQITALDNEIKLKVDTQTFNQYKQSTDNSISTINTKLSKATSDISVLQGQIALKVEQTDIDRAINEIEVGGRNLLPNSEEEKINDGSQWRPEFLRTYDLAPIFEKYGLDREYSLSFELKSADTSKNNRIQVYMQSGSGSKYSFINKTVEVTEDYQRFVFEGLKPTKGTGEYNTAHLSFYGTYGTGNIPIVRKIKLELGNKATDWTPAPEDIDQAINTVDTKIDNKVSEINLTLDSITQRVSSVESSVSTIDDEVTSLETRIQTAEQKITPTAIVSTVRQSTAYQNDLDGKVSKNNIISEINQTAEAIKIQASKIKLEGLVTANSNFKILSDGSIQAKNADISGKITANSGSISNWTLGTNIYAKKGDTYTTLKSGGDVAFAAGSSSPNDTTGAALQIFHDGRLVLNQNQKRRVLLNRNSLEFYTPEGNKIGRLYGDDQFLVLESESSLGRSEIFLSPSMISLRSNWITVATSPYAWDSGDIMHRGLIQSGTVEITPVPNQNTGVRLYFPTRFSKAPVVACTAHSDYPSDILEVTHSDRTSNYVNIVINRKNSTKTSVSWIAMVPEL